MTLTDFLLARIAEDEARTHMVRASAPSLMQSNRTPLALLDCKARRRIVQSCDAILRSEGLAGDLDDAPSLAASILRDLASVHVDHPDYREEWRP